MATNIPQTERPVRPAPIQEETLFVNAMRLRWTHWLAVSGIVLVVLVSTPVLWKRVERFDTGLDYRIPYQLSKDYWLGQHRIERLTATHAAIIGDSVIWGEYVRPDGTLSHFLSEKVGEPGKFVNLGVNGLFPLALEGWMRHYGEALHDRKLILHCNVLWMTSPKADLNTEKEERFNHASLVPQFHPRIPCYKADVNQRLAAVVEREFAFAQWANHVQIAYFGQQSLLRWTLAEDDHDPPGYPNAYKNPLTQIRFEVPTEPVLDPDRGPNSPRHKPWSTTGEGSTRFEWVGLDRSLQWAAFQRLVELLQSRGNDVLVVFGPFNEQMMAEENRAEFRRLRDDIVRWLANKPVAYVMPETLPSPLYADASHPLTEGYKLLADRIWASAEFQKWWKAAKDGRSAAP